MRTQRGWFHRWSHSTQSVEAGAGPCFRKAAYKTLEIAELYRAKSMAARPNTPLFIYQCDVCKQFHLTKQKQAPKGKEKSRVTTDPTKD